MRFLGALLYSEGAYAESAKLLEEAVAKGPEDRALRMQMGMTELKGGDTKSGAAVLGPAAGASGEAGGVWGERR